MISRQHIAQFESLKTPFYFYDMVGLSKHVAGAASEATRHGFHIHYALKANPEPPVLDVMLKQGFGADCVSGAEVQRALNAGFDPHKIAFAGVGKSDDELALAIKHNIFTINVESIEELSVIGKMAESLQRDVQIALRLNPDVDAKTHRYITTGLEENKFGISGWQLADVMNVIKANERIKLKGLHFHIGSQIRDLEPFKNLCVRINAIQRDFEDSGFVLDHINAGGGLGIDYDQPDEPGNPDFKSFFEVFRQGLELRSGQQLHFELGRSLVANFGDLISRVLFVKRGMKTNFLILDAGMTELIRPALYQALHKIENLSAKEGVGLDVYDVVGPVCESSDCFGKSIHLPKSERGDLMAIRSAGAYGVAMSSNYNLRTLHSPVFGW